jgi:hypothetical protein
MCSTSAWSAPAFSQHASASPPSAQPANPAGHNPQAIPHHSAAAGRRRTADQLTDAVEIPLVYRRESYGHDALLRLATPSPGQTTGPEVPCFVSITPSRVGVEARPTNTFLGLGRVQPRRLASVNAVVDPPGQDLRLALLKPRDGPTSARHTDHACNHRRV